MASVIDNPEQKILLDNVSWETFERLLAEKGENPVPRFHYDQGVLEIMSPSFEHDNASAILTLIIALLAEELEIDLEPAGSTTFKKKDLAKGFEPDACFYFQHAAQVRGKKRLDLKKDPPPDLAIEVVVTYPLVDKPAIYAAAGVSEIWRYQRGVLTIFTLDSGAYVEKLHGGIFPKVSGVQLAEFVQSHAVLTSTLWARSIRAFAQDIRNLHHGF